MSYLAGIETSKHENSIQQNRIWRRFTIYFFNAVNPFH